jgi:quercetin dioxygenase-like cupin family protein
MDFVHSRVALGPWYSLTWASLCPNLRARLAMPSERHPGSKVRVLREARGLAVDVLADRAGCEVGLVDQLESGDLDPSLAPLSKIARALGVRVGTLTDDEPVLGPVITRQGEYRSVSRFTNSTRGGDHPEMAFYSLAPGKSGRHMEPLVVDVRPEQNLSLSSHEGEEFIYVLEGSLEVEYGKDTYLLQAGDSIYYDSIVAHWIRAAGGEAARLLVVLHAPT